MPAPQSRRRRCKEFVRFAKVVQRLVNTLVLLWCGRLVFETDDVDPGYSQLENELCLARQSRF